MPRGQPDYGVYQQQQAIVGLADIGEGAARLDAINVFDRRGFTVWQDDFEAPVLRWARGKVTTGQLAVLSTTTFFSGIQSVLLNVPKGVTPNSYISRHFPLIRLGRVGVEFWLQGLTKAPGHFDAIIEIYDGVTPTSAHLVYVSDTDTISIWTGGVLTPIATNVWMSVFHHYFLPIKIVADMDTDYYTRLIIGETEYKLSTYPLTVLAPSAWRAILIWFYVFGSDADDMHMYLDNFILTQNEP